MGSLRQLPLRAGVPVDEITGTIPEGQHLGKYFRLRRYVVPLPWADAGTEFVTLEMGELRRCWRYSGRHIDGAAQQLRLMREALERARVLAEVS